MALEMLMSGNVRSRKNLGPPLGRRTHELHTRAVSQEDFFCDQDFLGENCAT